MAARTARHQHRHYKTLIVLVMSMTGGTMFLFWIGQLAPVTPLRSSTPTARTWTQIAVRSQDAREQDGFHHFKIDEAGRPSVSEAWDQAKHDARGSGTVHILVTCESTEARLTTVQAEKLKRLIDILRTEHRIAPDRVRISQSR